MITGMHVILFSRQAERVREFLSDVLELRSVDAGEGWPIFAAPPTEIAVHPTDEKPEHEVYLMCDDIDAAVARLARQGVSTDGPVNDRGWGLLTTLILPGGDRIGLYEPRHASPLTATGR
jgi:predicted enzyme related to lactoylglutathione lyase